jgi:uncharacterized Zn finger protein
MSFVLFTDEPCPKCQKSIRRTTIDHHPSMPATALQIYECTDCGTVKTIALSLRPGKRLAA